MKHWSIQQRLVAAALATIVLVGGLVAMSIGQIEHVARSLARVNDVNSVKQRYAINFRGSVHDRAISLRDVALARDDAEVARHTADIERLAARYAESAQRMDALFATRADTVSDEERRLLGDIKGVEQRAVPLLNAVIEKRRSGDTPGAQQLLASQAAQPFVDWLASINRLIDHEEALNKAESASVGQIVGRFAGWMSAAFVLMGAAVMALLWSMGRAVGRALERAIGCAEAIANGDLTCEVETRGLGETGRLLQSLARMRDALASTVSSVRGNADAVAAASARMAQGNQNLSGRTESQGAALQRAASTMEQLSTTVRNNADNARQAKDLAEGATTIASEGGGVVSQVVETMRDINEASRRIAEIIGTVDGIAFQTNILALNAAVEAARAGEHGRGFAVVAGEVRGLAQRSAEAAREIKSLIVDSVERIERGSALVDRAGQTMSGIVDATRRVSDIVAEITTATAEQSVGIDQVGQAVAEMDRGTQQNAALCEQSTASADSLRAQSAQLVEAVSTFKLAGQPA